MESLSDTKWDVVISGTGLQQSLLALALSRSGKNVLHVDTNDCYGANEAALSLQEADEWVKLYQAADNDAVFTAAQTTKLEGSEGLSFSRAYNLALAPHVIHTRSELLSQLVSSKAFRQIEFLAVGSFYIFQPASDASPTPSLSRIPSTREDVFSSTAIPVKSKRSLMKFLKFVLDYESEAQTELWKPHAEGLLRDFLAKEFKLDAELQAYIVTLTLSLDGRITVEAGLRAISRHLSSMGVFGPGFAAVYPKWGGLSEVAQVGCRAGAVGGTVYMLGVGIKDIARATEAETSKLSITLANNLVVETKTLIKGSDKVKKETSRVSRLVAIVNSPLSPLFVSVMEGAPTPSVSLVAFPSGTSIEGTNSEAPVYAMVHSSDAGECPVGQSVIYLTTIASPTSASLLETALSGLLKAAAPEGQEAPRALYQLRYEQVGGDGSFSVEAAGEATFSPLPVDLAFSDSVLSPVKEAWEMVLSGAPAEEERGEYMVFKDREGADVDEEYE